MERLARPEMRGEGPIFAPVGPYFGRTRFEILKLLENLNEFNLTNFTNKLNVAIFFALWLKKKKEKKNIATKTALTPSDINREAEIIIKRKSFFWLRRSRTKRRSAFLHGLLFFSAQRKASWKLPNGTIQCLIYASALVSLLFFFLAGAKWDFVWLVKIISCLILQLRNIHLGKAIIEKSTNRSKADLSREAFGFRWFLDKIISKTARVRNSVVNVVNCLVGFIINVRLGYLVEFCLANQS